jgi:hypothetical protein
MGTKKKSTLFLECFPVKWPCQESNLDLKLRRPEYYPLYYKAGFEPVNILFIRETCFL